jgi:hypothetical protein
MFKIAKYCLIMPLIVSIISCGSLRTDYLINHAYSGKCCDISHGIRFYKDSIGEVYEVSSIKNDTIRWKYKKGVIYFKKLVSSPKEHNNITTYLPYYAFYYKGHLAVINDSSQYLIYNWKIASLEMMYSDRYISYVKESGLEEKLLNGCFGNSRKINRRLNKVKPLGEIFKD